jgi:hypothetical protein
MKKADLKLGVVYTNQGSRYRERFRVITGFGPYKLYDSQAETDCVRYLAVKVTKDGFKFDPGTYDHEGLRSWEGGDDCIFHHSTRASFASWAKGEANAADADLVLELLPPRQEWERDERMETGPIQFDDDWPGVFLRGDNAIGFGLHLRAVLDSTEIEPIGKAVLEGLYDTLMGCDTRKQSSSPREVNVVVKRWD